MKSESTVEIYCIVKKEVLISVFFLNQGFYPFEGFDEKLFIIYFRNFHKKIAARFKTGRRSLRALLRLYFFRRTQLIRVWSTKGFLILKRKTLIREQLFFLPGTIFLVLSVVEGQMTQIRL